MPAELHDSQSSSFGQVCVDGDSQLRGMLLHHFNACAVMLLIINVYMTANARTKHSSSRFRKFWYCCAVGSISNVNM